MASTKEEVLGATVMLYGTKIGTTADMQGNYQLVIPHDTATLLFLSVGFESLKKKIVVVQDTTTLPPVHLKMNCHLDFFYQKHVELSLLSGLHYTPLGGKIKFFYPYLIDAQHSLGALRTEFSYQLGNNNFQRSATLALDNTFVDCDNNVDVTTDYQSVRLDEQEFAYTRYTVGVTYTGKAISRIMPVYLAVGRLNYSDKEISRIKAGMEIGAAYPFTIYLNASHTKAVRLMAMSRVAWWQDYWQFQSGVETEVKRFSLKINFNRLGQYAEVNTGVGFKIERRYHTNY